VLGPPGRPEFLPREGAFFVALFASIQVSLIDLDGLVRVIQLCQPDAESEITSDAVENDLRPTSDVYLQFVA